MWPTANGSQPLMEHHRPPKHARDEEGMFLNVKSHRLDLRDMPPPLQHCGSEDYGAQSQSGRASRPAARANAEASIRRARAHHAAKSNSHRHRAPRDDMQREYTPDSAAYPLQEYRFVYEAFPRMPARSSAVPDPHPAGPSRGTASSHPPSDASPRSPSLSHTSQNHCPETFPHQPQQRMYTSHPSSSGQSHPGQQPGPYRTKPAATQQVSPEQHPTDHVHSYGIPTRNAIPRQSSCDPPNMDYHPFPGHARQDTTYEQHPAASSSHARPSQPFNGQAFPSHVDPRLSALPQRGTNIHPPSGIVPIELGGGSTQEDAWRLWWSLDERDQKWAIDVWYTRSEEYRQEFSRLWHYRKRTNGPASQHVSAENAWSDPIDQHSNGDVNREKPSQTVDPSPSFDDDMSSPSGWKAGQQSTSLPGDAAPSPVRFKTVIIEDAEEDPQLSPETNPSDATPLSEAMPQSESRKGKERARDTHRYSQPASGEKSPRPNRPPYTPIPRDNSEHIVVVLLDAVNRCDERIDQLGKSVTQSIDMVRDQLASIGAKPMSSAKRASTGDRKSKAPRTARRSLAHSSDQEDFTNEMLDVSAGEEDEDEDPLQRLANNVKLKSRTKMSRDQDFNEELQVALDKQRAYVRHHCDQVLLGIHHVRELPHKFPPLTESQVDEYQKAGVPPLDSATFRIDFRHGWKRFPLNQEARQFFIRHFQESVAGGSYQTPPIHPRFSSDDEIGLSLDGHIAHLRAEYRKHSSAKDKTPEKEKNAQDAVNAKRASVRRRTTYHCRAQVILDRHLDQHAALFATLKPVHMSSDEAAIESSTGKQWHPRLFYIVEAAWQSAEFKNFVRTLDAMYIENWKRTCGDRLSSGNAPRVRVSKENPTVVNSVAPVGLWRNCYDAEWLSKLKQYQRNALYIIDPDYDFSLPVDE